MYFVDSSGHTFFQQSFDYRPVGYEYYKNKYIFWIDNKDHSYCSVNNYYIRPIYILTDKPVSSLEIQAGSAVFALLSSRNVVQKFKNCVISIDESDFKAALRYDESWAGNESITIDDNAENVNDIIELPVLSVSNEEKTKTTKYVYPFYVVATSSEVGSFMTNILIRAAYRNNSGQDDVFTSYEYCYITVGAEFNEENEILYINGQNMGVRLPHEILRAVYEGSYLNGEFDEVLYNEKLKEYLLEYMQIRGEIGNYNSAIQSLKWFGWGDKLELVSLLETDNQFMIQFVRDYFDTSSDILDSFKHFVNSTMLSLIVWENKETGKYNDYDLKKDFIGENQPELENLFDKQIAVKYGGVGEETYYYRSYYNFVIGELLYKLSTLRYYYEHFFLPVHLSIHNASLHHKVYANDIKMICSSSEHITEPIVKMGLWKDPYVEFPMNNEIWLTEQVHYIDELFNEWKFDDLDAYAENREIYYIHDTCANIPLKFLNYTTDEKGNIIYNDEAVHVHLILEKLTSEADNVLYINRPINLHDDILHIYDITDHEIDLNNIRVSYSNDGGRTYSTYFYGINSLKEILINDKTSTVELSKSDNEYVLLYNGELITIKDEPQYIHIKDDNGKLIRVIYIPSLNEIHEDVLGAGAECNIVEFDTLLLRFRIPNDRIGKCIIETGDEMNNITSDITIRYSPSSDIFYESDFTFNSAHEEYNDLVIYPKMFNNVYTDSMTNAHGKKLTNKNIDITYFINSKFRLRMLVNNTWHSYEFTVRMPDINIDFGRLIYKYYDDELKYSTRFNQLNKLTPDTLGFNAFMHEPRLTRVNDINFLENFLRYINISTARYIDGSVIPTNEFCQYIDVTINDELTGETHSQRIYINNENIGKDLVVPRKYFNYDVLFYLFLDPNMLYIFAETGNNNTYEVLGTNTETFIYETNNPTQSNDVDEYVPYNDPNNYKLFKYNIETNKYEVSVSTTVTPSGILEFPVKESLRSDSSSLAQQYIETHAITNKYKYLNQIHVYDLYRLNDHTGDNILFLQNNIDMMYHGIRFTHDNFLSGNLIHISGNTNNLILNSDVRKTDNKSFESSLDKIDNSTIYDSYVNTYDDLTIYSAYEGDWIQTLNLSDDDVMRPSGYVYYEQVNDGKPTGKYTTKSISIIGNEKQFAYVVTDGEQKYSYEYIDVKTFDELDNIFSSYSYITDINADLSKAETYKINNNGSLHIERDNINSPITPVMYKVEIVKKLRNSETGIVINPTHSEYYNKIREYFRGNPSVNDNEDTYEMRIRFFATINKVVNNIQHIYTGNAEYNNGVYTTIINNRQVVLTPFYSGFDQSYDKLFNHHTLINQPGFDWIDIKDLDDTIQNINYNDDNDYINILDIKDVHESDEYKNDDDITHILSYRKLMILNVTTRLINSVKNYEHTNIFDDYADKYKNDNSNDNIDIAFKINSNQNDTDDNNVKIKTILRARYSEDGKEHYEYYDDVFHINGIILKSENDVCYIDCGLEDTEFIKPFINHRHVDAENNKTTIRKYDEFIVFFVIVPNEINNNKEFEIDINPDIRLVYKDYDMLEYPTDSFKNYNYEGDEFVDYVINDTTYKYGDCRSSEQVIKLYNEFFKERTIIELDEYNINSIDAIDELNIDKNLVEYDMYLMHDIKNWYIVYISKDTCDKSMALYDYAADDDIVFVSETGQQYKLVKTSSVKKFLINRYVYSSKEGKYHFNTDDIIVGKVLNNERLPIDIFKSSKWELTPVSFAIDKNTHTSTSNIDMCIFDVPMYNDEYVKGYYDVTYRYSLDRISTQQYKKYGTIRIG